MKEEQVRATIVLKDGRRLDKFIEHVVGSVERPMSDADLEAKFLGLADGVLPAAQARTLMDVLEGRDAAARRRSGRRREACVTQPRSRRSRPAVIERRARRARREFFQQGIALRSQRSLRSPVVRRKSAARLRYKVTRVMVQ